MSDKSSIGTYIKNAERAAVLLVVDGEPTLLQPGQELHISHTESEIRHSWISVKDRLPEAPFGKEIIVWVCAEREGGKRFVYPLWWVNRPYLEEHQGAPWVIETEDGDPMDCVGWHEKGANYGYDEFFMPEEHPEQIIAWMPIEKPEAPK